MIEGLPEFLAQSGNSNSLILYELCSSSAHPIQNREIFKFLPAEEATWIVTINPDRLTRRSDEVKRITEHLQTSGGGWLTSGIQRDDVELSDWLTVDEEKALNIETAVES
ncbi:hypothetical protein IWZ01DRAFT_480842 [Phyllosticta capitalensis]